MRIVEVSPRSAPDLAALHAEAFAAAWSATEIETLLNAPGVFALAARKPEGTAAFVMVRVAADEAEILTLATRPGARREGLARALVEGAAAAAAGFGAAAMILEVAEANAAALALYAGFGFEAVGRRRGYYATAEGPADALILRRELRGAP